MDRPADDQPDDRSPSDVDPFDAIVSGWRRDGPVPEWPDGESPAPAAPVPTAPAAPAASAAPAEEDDHFVPPEPPPIPRLGPPALIGLALLVLGVVLVAVPGWLGVSPVHGLPLGLLALAAGLGWLVLRLWPSPPGPGDGDNGAVV